MLARKPKPVTHRIFLIVFSSITAKAVALFFAGSLSRYLSEAGDFVEFS